MIIGDRLRELRNKQKLSQGEIENRSGLQRAYLSRVENGHTVPAVETLEKFARALEVRMYQLFYANEEWRDRGFSSAPRGVFCHDWAGDKPDDSVPGWPRYLELLKWGSWFRSRV